MERSPPYASTPPAAPALMLNSSEAVPAPPAFIALRETVKLPEVDGVPEMRPVLVSMDKPAGRPLAA